MDRRSLYTHPVEFREDEHIRNTFRSVALSLGADPGDGQLIPIIVNQEESAFLTDFFHRYELNDNLFLTGINVNASEVARERRWPQERFAELADRIASVDNCRIILLGSPAEKEYVEQVASMMTTAPIITAGKTTLHQMIALLNRLNLFISNDSGPVHMACAQGTPTIAIFGPESPKRYGPIGDQHRTVYLGLPCSPCISFHNAKKVQCPNSIPLCIYDITTDQIWAVVRPFLPVPTAAANADSSYT
jgi:ADP-heptose:LPS heptosyltransferase